MNAFEAIQNKTRGERTPLEQCIHDAAGLEDMRDGEYDLMEKAADDLVELVHAARQRTRNDIKVNTMLKQTSMVLERLIKINTWDDQTVTELLKQINDHFRPTEKP
jgi:hypothetical protein